MPLKMAAADLVISRAGAMTVTEMAKMKKACIMIPSPYVADNHQYKNAKVLADVGAVELLEEKELSGKKIVELTKGLLNDASRRHEMENKIADFAGENAGEIIYKEIEKLLK
jgi:UDP-N-acetylglucosamine--N-acetylmuramyl-(pentapeptide) pyrophosphoryl-undecaprenol N-acetylglucosamine transferase